jgi:hypothetical protein
LAWLIIEDGAGLFGGWYPEEQRQDNSCGNSGRGVDLETPGANQPVNQGGEKGRPGVSSVNFNAYYYGF